MKRGGQQQGFSLVIVLVIIAAIAGLAFAGWYVWHKNKQDKKTGDTNTSQTTKNEDEEAASEEASTWLLATTQAGGLSMRIPDGWKVTNFPGDYLAGTDVTYRSGVDAVVSATNTDYTGHSLRLKVTIAPLDDAGLGPQWASPQPGVEESTQNFSIGSLQGKRFKATFPEGNQTLYEYVFSLGDSKKLDIVYRIHHDEHEKDDVTTVEKAIKTIVLK